MSRSNKDQKEKAAKSSGFFGGLLGSAEKSLKTRKSSVDKSVEQMVRGGKSSKDKKRKKD